MTALTKGIYGWETDPKKTPFGLLNNQIRANAIITSAGWYNANGERLGCGDLSLKDMKHISKSIKAGQMFFVLTEADAIWNLPSHLDRSAPGKDYVIQNASWIIGGARGGGDGGIIIRSRIGDVASEPVETDGVKYLRMSRKEIQKQWAVSSKAKDKVATKAKDGVAEDDFGPVKSTTKTVKRKPVSSLSSKPIKQASSTLKAKP